eukprot:SAG31_NODE_1606_length_7761_cov_4.493996_7_plen_109_part_00
MVDAETVFGADGGHRIVVMIKANLSSAIGHMMRTAPEVERMTMANDAIALKQATLRQMEAQLGPENLQCIQESCQLASLLKRSDRCDDVYELVLYYVLNLSSPSAGVA